MSHLRGGKGFLGKMRYFVYSGKKRIYLRLKNKDVEFLYKRNHLGAVPKRSIRKSLQEFFTREYKRFLNKKVCVVIPDNTREFHPELILKPVFHYLKKLSKDVDCTIALGLHRKLSRKELDNFLGKDFTIDNKVTQHPLQNVKFLGEIHGVKTYLNKNLFLYDAIFTIGVVEPHLYAGFSGGVKCIGVGLAGKETILGTHSIEFLSQKGVRVSNVESNPFQNFLWEVIKVINIPVYSLNIVNNSKNQISFYSLGEAREAFFKSVIAARDRVSYKLKDQFDVLFVGCDYPKDKSLYQASRLFNYVLDKKKLVKRGGMIFVFANLGVRKKSAAEKNFEDLLKKSKIPSNYLFKKPGEHRAFKVIEASKYASLGIITSDIKPRKIHYISFFSCYNQALKKAEERFGNKFKIGIIPVGFSFIPG